MDERSFRRYLAAQIQQRQGASAHARRDQALRAADEREHDAVWEAVQSHLGGVAAGAAVRLVVPSGPARRGLLAQRRITAYLQHLQAVVSEAASGGGVEAVVDSASAAQASGSPIEQQLCTLCRGGCCTMGGDRAYLTVDTMRRVMRHHPQWSPAEVVQAYRDRIAPQTQRGSCINHTKDGCSLPREMRSDTCNDFACSALSALQQAPAEAAASQHVMVIRRRLGKWTRATNPSENVITGIALLTDEGVRRLPLNLVSAATGARAGEKP
jgi:hypothetical protein